MGIYEELQWRGLIKDVSDPSLKDKLNDELGYSKDLEVIINKTINRNKIQLIKNLV